MLEIATEGADGSEVHLLKLTGALDLATITSLEEHVSGHLAAGRVRLVVDLSGLTFCDSVGLNGLVRAKNRCEEQGGWLKVAGTHGQVAHVISVAGLLDALAADD